LVEKGTAEAPDAGAVCDGLEDPKLGSLLPDHAAAKLREDVEMARGLCPAFNHRSYQEGHLTPVYFGSAINNFGVRELIQGLADMAPAPLPYEAVERTVEPAEDKVTGFVFKIQANMDPKHRDRIAFVRLCSGHFKRGMKMRHVRTGKTLTLHNPQLFLAQERERAEEAFAADISGVPNRGNLRIGDTLTEGEALHFNGVPSFAPEVLQKARPADPLRSKHLGRALQQIAEEGAARVFKPRLDPDWIVGVVGPLQFEVLADRIRTEYDVPVRFESTALHTARWLESADDRLLKKFRDANEASIAEDHTGNPVFLARNDWHLDKALEDWPDIQFLKTKEQSA
ncbi:MAG: peptide chain release factor 3, partial [Alphaproteobacteria bacterium]|nr:peptide chain release factor 3 [Alphaproteobacteria bacterium]